VEVEFDSRKCHATVRLVDIGTRRRVARVPHHRLRAQIVPLVRGAQKKKGQRGEGVEATPRHVAMTFPTPSAEPLKSIGRFASAPEHSISSLGDPVGRSPQASHSVL
jgi:hypothetical protein